MKKIFGALLSVVMVFLLSTPLVVFADVKEQPSRAIHVVYDDSTSMIVDDFSKEPVDRWCQAKYAMEVFASMLGEKDTMSIYAMSDFVYSETGSPVLTVSGSESVEARVQSVHDMITAASNTPFESAEQAFTDLQTASADEKWLVILTDGVFNYIDSELGFQERTDEYIAERLNSFIAGGEIKVIYLAMAEHAKTIKENEDAGLYFDRADSGDEILGCITDISNQIFQQNKIVVEDNAGYSFSTDIPLSEAVIFAQGPNVVITGLENEETGEVIQPESQVSVKYSEKATTLDDSRYQGENLLINDKLTGVVGNFGQMPAGKYKIKLSGVTTVEVYYKPNVKIVTRLFDAEGNEMKEGRFIEGTYTLEFGLADPETGEILNSTLLGDVEYEAIVSMNGSQKEMKSGDQIVLEPGALDISVSGTYLEYNKVEADLSYEVFHASKPLEFQVDVPKEGWQLTTDALTANGTDHILVTVLLNGEVISQDMWNAMETLNVTTKDNVNLHVEKGSDLGTFKIYPEVFEGDALETDDGTIKIKMDGAFEVDGELFEGEGESEFEISSEISLKDKLLHWLKKYWWVLLLIVLLIIIIIAFWKRKLLPKKLKAQNLEYVPALGIPVGPGSSMKYSKTQKWWHQKGSLTFEGMGVKTLYVSMSIVAIQNWTVKRRKALVVGFNAAPSQVRTISIGGTDFEYDSERNVWVNGAGKTPKDANNVRVGAGTNITITGTTSGQTFTVTIQ